MYPSDERSRWPAGLLTDARVSHRWDEQRLVGGWYWGELPRIRARKAPESLAPEQGPDVGRVLPLRSRRRLGRPAGDLGLHAHALAVGPATGPGPAGSTLGGITPRIEDRCAQFAFMRCRGGSGRLGITQVVQQ